jgi:leader peptidase (prepilin peptidase) / N-methyltransferase
LRASTVRLASNHAPRRGILVLAILIVGCGLFGLAIGSFLNVVIYRVPRHESIVKPRSACPKCGTPILERDNVPVLSWLLLRGKCRTCREPISIRYPLIELACAALFAGAAARLGYNWDLPAFLVFLATLLALSAIDVELMILPKVIIFPSLFAVAVLLTVDAAVTNDWHRLLIAALCGAGWFVLFFVINFASPRALGFGDVRLSTVLGLCLGWLGIRYVILGFFAANLVGAVLGLVLIATKKMSREQPIPYGVFLAAGAAIALYAGPEILSPFRNFSFHAAMDLLPSTRSR